MNIHNGLKACLYVLALLALMLLWGFLLSWACEGGEYRMIVAILGAILPVAFLIGAYQ